MLTEFENNCRRLATCLGIFYCVYCCWLCGILEYSSDIWDTSLIYGILVSCFGYLSYVWDTSPMFWKETNHVSSGCNYGVVYCLMYGMLVLCLRYLSYVWDNSLMSGILVLCLRYLFYVWDISLMSGILVLCLGY